MTTWHIEHPYGEPGTYITDENTALIAKVYNKADAPLIAAAPDLLAALEGLANIALHPRATKSDIRMIASEARAAIAKAKG